MGKSEGASSVAEKKFSQKQVTILYRSKLYIYPSFKNSERGENKLVFLEIFYHIYSVAFKNKNESIPLKMVCSKKTE